MSETASPNPQPAAPVAPVAPPLPARLIDPRPLIATFTIAWIVATAIVLASGDRWDEALPTCFVGVALGAIGYAIFFVQRRAFRRGSRGAQQGLR